MAQRDLIAMKLILHVSCRIPDVYARFQVHISKHIEINFPLAWNSVEIPLQCLWPPEDQKLANHDENRYGSRHLLHKCVYHLKALYRFLRPYMKKNEFGPFLAVIYVRLTRSWWNCNSVCGITYQMSVPRFKLRCQNMYKKFRKTFRWWGALLRSPFRVFLSARGPNIAQPWRKSVRGRHSLNNCVHKIGGLYINLEAMNVENGFDLFLAAK